MIAFALERAFFAPGVQGWENATKKCFQKQAEDLSLSDAAVLIIQMGSPWKEWAVQGEDLMKRRNSFLRRMVADGYATEDDVSAAVSSPLVYCSVS